MSCDLYVCGLEITTGFDVPVMAYDGYLSFVRTGRAKTDSSNPTVISVASSHECGLVA